MFSSRYVKGAHFFNDKCTRKGYLFCQNDIKKVRCWPLPVKDFVRVPPNPAGVVNIGLDRFCS